MRSFLLFFIIAQIPAAFGDCSWGVTPEEPAGITISQINGTSVRLEWRSVEGARSYKVTWEAVDSNDMLEQGVTAVPDRSIVIDSLTPGRTYEFHVQAMRVGNVSTPTTASWTLPARYTTDRSTGGEIRLYTRAAPGDKGAGLIIDPKFGGPRSASVGSSNPELHVIHLVADVRSTKFSIGPPQGFTAFAQVASFREDVYCVDTLYRVGDLAFWQDSVSLEKAHVFNRINPFRDIDALSSDGLGVGLLLRFGSPLPSVGYRYARILVKPDENNMFIRVDEEGYHYIVLEIAYQPSPDVPYV